MEEELCVSVPGYVLDSAVSQVRYYPPPSATAHSQSYARAFGGGRMGLSLNRLQWLYSSRAVSLQCGRGRTLSPADGKPGNQLQLEQLVALSLKTTETAEGWADMLQSEPCTCVEQTHRNCRIAAHGPPVGRRREVKVCCGEHVWPPAAAGRHTRYGSGKMVSSALFLCACRQLHPARSVENYRKFSQPPEETAAQHLPVRLKTPLDHPARSVFCVARCSP